MKPYKIVDDPDLVDEPPILPQELKDQLEDLYDRVTKGKQSVKHRLDKLCKRFPAVPMLWNFQVIWHEQNQKTQKAREINDQLFENFPDYLYARVQKASYLISEYNLEEACTLLGGSSLDLSTLYPNRSSFHISEFRAYTRAAVQYLAASRQFDEAETYIKNLKFAKDDMDFLDQLYSVIKIEEERIEMQQLAASLKNRKSASTEPDELLEPSSVFGPLNDQFYYLYDDSLWDIESEQLQFDIETNLAPLLEELHYILEKATQTTAPLADESAWGPETLHATLILGYLDAEKEFDGLLRLLSRPEEIVDFWLGDYVTDIIATYFQQPTELLLQKAVQFVTRPLVTEYPKSAVLESLNMMVLADPSYREKVTEALGEMMEAFYTERENPDLMDPEVVGFLVATALDIRADSLLPLIEKLFKENLVALEIAGDFEEVKRAFTDDETRYSPFKIHTTVFDHLKALGSFHNGDSDDDDDFDDFDDDFFSTEGAIHPQKMYHNTPRNAPCPCGSGKKYKRCHGK